jgi:hypothetical protein
MNTTSTFSVYEVEDFLLNIGQRFAHLCWHNDMITDGCSDRVSHSVVSNWFGRYFPSNTNQYLFRLLEAHCVQFSPDVN